MAQCLNVDFKKFITHNGKNIFELIKTKTNKYYLIDLKTNKIIASTKRQILQKIKEYGEKILESEEK